MLANEAGCVKDLVLSFLFNSVFEAYEKLRIIQEKGLTVCDEKHETNR